MDVSKAALAVLGEAQGEDLHWTVIWDRALRQGYIDAFTQAGERSDFLRALGELVRRGAVEKTSKGTYRAVPSSGGGR